MSSDNIPFIFKNGNDVIEALLWADSRLLYRKSDISTPEVMVFSSKVD